MDTEEFNKMYEENKELKKAFQHGYECGEKRANEQIKHNKIMYTLLLETIGYDDAWLMTVVGYKKRSKNELIDIILKQRALMRKIYNASQTEKEKLKDEVEKLFWPGMVEHDIKD